MRRTQNRYIFASESARKSRRFRGLKVLLILIPLLLAALWVGNLTVSRRVILKDLRLTVLNLPPDLEEYSILHISDLRGARYGKAQKAVAAALGSTRYSCVVMTGDMLGEDGELEPLLELFPGVVLSRFTAGGQVRFVISKSGGFGEETLLTDLRERIERPITEGASSWKDRFLPSPWATLPPLALRSPSRRFRSRKMNI